MMEDTMVREDDNTRLQSRARIASMAQTLGLEVVVVPGDGNYFLHAARFALLQLHGWNYDQVLTHEAMRAQVCLFMKEKLAYRDPRPIPSDDVVLGPPRLSFYDSWDQWVNEME